MLDIPHFSIQICSWLLLARVCAQSGCFLWPAPGWALMSRAPLPSCGLAGATPTAPEGQPLCWQQLSPSSVPAPFPYPCRPGVVTASPSSSSLGASLSLFPLTLSRRLNNLFITCSSITSQSVPCASCRDRKTKTLTGKSQEFWAQFSSVQFNSANIY